MKAMDLALQLCEKYNIACFSYKGILNLSQIEEVKSTNEFLTFDDKYLDGGLKETTKENRIIPANIDESLEKEIHSFTKTIYKNHFYGHSYTEVLNEIDNISLEEIKYISSKLETKVNEIEELTQITANTISEVTHYTTVSIGPNVNYQIIKEIK